jgi:hypothetical protein
MKKILLLLLLSNLVLAQQPDVEIRLVNANVGTSIVYNQNQVNEYTASNDAGINSILNSYGVRSYIIKGGHPYQPYSGRIISIAGVFPQQFVNDLLSYSSVVQYASISDKSYFSDALNLKLVNLNVGTPIGYNGNIVVTNNTALNQIFQNYNVFYFAQLYPTSTSNVNLRSYTAVCNCNANSLKTDLNNLSSVIESVNNFGAAYLSNNQFEKSKTKISPNPFLNVFSIETEDVISKYTIFDSTGKQIESTSNKNELDNQVSKLQAGFYILNLAFENGKAYNYKLVKK